MVSSGRGGARRIKVSQLNYVEVQGHTLLFHLQGEVFSAVGSMSEVESQLDEQRFFRCNKGYLVNLEQVESVQGGMAIVGGEQVQISRAKKKAFLDALNDYMNEVAK